MKRLSYLIIGSEILDGRVLDTNSQFFSTLLGDYGIAPYQVLTCDDVLEEIVDSLTFLFRSSDIVIASGGLGPTSDDLTREAVAAYFDVPLQLNEEVLTWLKDLYEKRKRTFDPSNTKQATFPRGSIVLPNPVGTAAGFKISDGKHTVYSLPGVPKEMKEMFPASVLPEAINAFVGAEKLTKKAFKVFGLPEAVIGSKIKALNLPNEIFVSYRASFPEVHVVLKSKTVKNLSVYAEQVKEALGSQFIYSENLGETLEEVVHKLLLNQKKTVSVAESCTGGLVGKLLTETPGTSKTFVGGVIAYDNSVKENFLDVSKAILEVEGAVSEAAVLQMAKACKEKFYSSIAISVSGIAGPDGGSPAKPVGTFFIGVSSETGPKSYKFFLKSSRDLIRKFAAYKALDIVRRELLELSAPEDAIVENL